MQREGKKGLPKSSSMPKHIESEHANEQCKHNAQYPGRPVKQFEPWPAPGVYDKEIDNPEHERKHPQEH